MHQIKIQHCSPMQAIERKDELLASGLVAGRDFEWRYNPATYDNDGYTAVTPREAVYEFVDPSLATFLNSSGLMAKPRFVVSDVEVSMSLGVPRIVLLADIGFWNDHYEELKTWCNVYGAEIQGMTVNLYSEETVTAFCLKWS